MPKSHKLYTTVLDSEETLCGDTYRIRPRFLDGKPRIPSITQPSSATFLPCPHVNLTTKLATDISPGRTDPPKKP